MNRLAPATWWRGLGGLTRSGSAVEGLSWALYDFANTIFSFAIVSYAMSLWAIRYLGEAGGQFWFTFAVSASVLINAAVSPVLGAMSDRTGSRKPYLARLHRPVTIVPTLVIGLVNVGIGLFFFAFANFGYQAALIYYDALLPDVARPETRGRLSGVGVALGYLGTIVSGLPLRCTTDANGDSTAASFLLVGSLFAVFAAPIFLRVRERSQRRQPFRVGDALRSWSQLQATIAHARQTPGLLRFIVGRFFYSDPVNTAIVVMSAFATQAIGFTSSEALNILLLLTVVAVIASFGWGWLTDRIGPKRTLLWVLISWTGGLLLLGLVLDKIPFLLAGAVLGSGLGGVAVTDRLLLLRLAPPEQVGEMLGLYGLAGKFSAVVGPIAYGSIVGLLLAPLGKTAYQIAILSLLVLMVIGFLIVRRVPEGVVASRRGSGAGNPHRAGHRAAGRDAMTIVVAHRGAAADAPENTMLAYQLAVEMGADAIELDVHLTKDGRLALIHDETLDRTTNLTGPVAAKTLAQIRRADAGYRFEASDGSFPFRGRKLRVPTLAEVLDWLPDGVGLVVEIKAREATAATIEALRTSRVRAAQARSASSASTSRRSTRRTAWTPTCRSATCSSRSSRPSRRSPTRSSTGTRRSTPGRGTSASIRRRSSPWRAPMAGWSAATW